MSARVFFTGDPLADEGTRPGPAVAAVEAYVGCALDDTVMVSAQWPLWQQASVQRGLDAYPAELGAEAEWVGVSSPHREHQDILELLRFTNDARLTKAVWTEAAAGPDVMVEALDFGMAAASSPDGVPLVLVMRRSMQRGPDVSIEILAAERGPARDALARLRELIGTLDVLRGQVLSFGVAETYGNEMVTFLAREVVPASDVILPEGTLDRIQSHIVDVGERAPELRGLGIHLRRGLLLYGPPGTGKTHTVRHLIGASAATVFILSGGAFGLIEHASALARRLQPAIVVLEDVDLVAGDRSFSESNPLLFSLLNSMDGVSSDADVTFILTTNRVHDLEEALVQRPGRVDLAVEIPVPDEAARRRLMDLYRGSLPMTADPSAAVAALDGATASAVKELMRRCALRALREQGDTAVVTQEILDGTVADFTAAGDELTRRLLGAPERG